MSEFSVEDDPDPLPELRNGLHYYDVHDFLKEIVRPDSCHTLQYREWYPTVDDSQGLENDPVDGVYDVLEVNAPASQTGILRWLGRFAYFGIFE